MMKFSIGAGVIIFLGAAFEFITAVDAQHAVPKVLCGTPVPSTVALDEPKHRYYPYFVRLYRCQGSVGTESPNIKQCVAKGYEEKKRTVFDTANGWKTKELTVRNHTRCGYQCKASARDCDSRVQTWNEQSCTCECLHPHSPPPKEVIKPRKGFRWNNYLCRYECGRPRKFCKVKKMWSNKECTCVCKPFYEVLCENGNMYMDPKTCTCIAKEQAVGRSTSSSAITNTEFKILLAFLGFLMVVIIALSICIFRLHRKSESHRFGDSATTSEADFVDPGQDNPAAKYETSV